MCLLIAMNPGACPQEMDLLDAARNNPDGFGYAIVVGDRIVTHRGMSASKVITDFLEDRARWSDGPAIFHARFATHGDVNKANCHPFRVGGSQKTYMAHNGILPLPLDATERRSDSRVFAEDLLPRFGQGALDNFRARTALEDWLGSDKIAVLSVDPSHGKQLYILNEREGHWGDAKHGDDGVWYSNYSYAYIPATLKSVVDEYTDDKLFGEYEVIEHDDPDTVAWWARHAECESCGAAMDVNDDVCEYCDACRWCGTIAPATGECDCGYGAAGEGDRAALDNLLAQLAEKEDA